MKLSEPQWFVIRCLKRISELHRRSFNVRGVRMSTVLSLVAKGLVIERREGIAKFYSLAPDYETILERSK